MEGNFLTKRKCFDTLKSIVSLPPSTTPLGDTDESVSDAGCHRTSFTIKR